MLKIKFLNLLIIIENILSVYRNYSNIKTYRKILAVARVTLGIFLNAAAFVVSMLQTIYFLNGPFLVAQSSVHNILLLLNSIAPMIIGISRAFSFKTLMDNVNRVHEYCSEDVTYEKKLNNLRKVILGVILVWCYALFVSFYFLSFLNSVLRLSERQDAAPFTTYIPVIQVVLAVTLIWREIRFHFEILTINILIRIITISLEQLKTKLVTLAEILDDTADGIDDLTCYQFHKNLEKWISAYNNLALFSGGINSCFGIQITSSLCLLTFYFMCLCYHWVARLASKEPAIDASIITLLTIYTIAMIVLLYTCQYAQNEGKDLKRLMAKLYGKILTIPGANVLELKRLVGDCHRQMSVQPMLIQIISTTNLQMSLLLTILSTSVSYVIVMLQFNHVV